MSDKVMASVEDEVGKTKKVNHWERRFEPVGVCVCILFVFF